MTIQTDQTRAALDRAPSGWDQRKPACICRSGAAAGCPRHERQPHEPRMTWSVRVLAEGIAQAGGSRG